MRITWIPNVFIFSHNNICVGQPDKFVIFFFSRSCWLRLENPIMIYVSHAIKMTNLYIEYLVILRGPMSILAHPWCTSEYSTNIYKLCRYGLFFSDVMVWMEIFVYFIKVEHSLGFNCQKV
ncbi:hypothetical protein QTP88_018099 [Uroleucon formosanum]